MYRYPALLAKTQKEWPFILAMSQARQIWIPMKKAGRNKVTIINHISFVPELCSIGMNQFLDRRKGDIRTNAVRAVNDLKSGNIFYITCIDEPHKLKPLYEKYKDSYHCVYQTDIYTKEQWLEIMPLNASKANAIKQLQSLLKCEKLVAFGDGKNDIDMFETADECYAVQNAHEDLKRIATEIISSNEEDGVAKWLDENVIKK